MAPTIDYNGYVSVSNILNRPDFMDADDLRQNGMKDILSTELT